MKKGSSFQLSIQFFLIMTAVIASFVSGRYTTLRFSQKQVREANKASTKTDANDASKGSTKKSAAKGKKGKAATKDIKTNADKENSPAEAKTKKNSGTKKKPETVDSSAIFEATPEAVTKRKPKKTAVVKGNNVEKN